MELPGKLSSHQPLIFYVCVTVITIFYLVHIRGILHVHVILYNAPNMVMNQPVLLSPLPQLRTLLTIYI